MEKHLQLLLKEVNTVILPGLGALTITNHATGEIMFMPYLKYDDGKLSSFIVSKTGMGEAEAKDLISSGVQEILSAVENGSTKELKGLGVFSKDGSGEIIFETGKTDPIEESTSDTIAALEVKEEGLVESIIETPIVTEEVTAELIVEEAPKEIEAKEEIVEESIVETIVTEEQVIEKIVLAENVEEEKVPVIAENVPLEYVQEEEKVVKEEPFQAPVSSFVEPVIDNVEDNSIQEEAEKVVPKKKGLFGVFKKSPKEVVSLEEKAKEETSVVEEVSKPIVAVQQTKVVDTDSASPGNKEESDDELELISESKQEEVLPKKKSKIGFFVKLFLILMIIGGGTYFGLNFDNLSDSLPFVSHNDKKTEEEIIDNAENSTISPEELKEGEGKEMLKIEEEGIPSETTKSPDPEKVIEEPVSTSTNSGPNDVKQTFYIILGSFSDKANADNFVAKLKAEGKEGASTVDRGGKYSVSLTSYSNIDDANDKIAGHKSEFPNAWILKM